MRREPFGIGSVLHVMKRGARGLPITKGIDDQWRFVRLLYYMNDEYKDDFWEQSTRSLGTFERPKRWPKRKSLVKIYAWVLMPNHFHLVLEEIQDGGTSRFMQKLCGSMSVHFNLKYEEIGSLFQGPYKSRTVGRDEYFRYLIPYVMVKNVFELYLGGFDAAAQNFEEAWKWATQSYAFSCLPDYFGRQDIPIIDPTAHAMFDSPKSLKSLSKDMVLGRLEGNFFLLD